MRFPFFGFLAALAALTPAACSSDSNPNPVGGGGSGGNQQFETGGPGTCTNSFRPVNDAFCGGGTCTEAPDCSSGSQRPVEGCCVPMLTPGGNPASPTLRRTTDTRKYADPDGRPVDLSCFDPAGYPAKPTGTPELVTMSGVVDAFSNGCDLKGVKIEVYTVKRTGNPADDGAIDQLQGTAVVTTENDDYEVEDIKKCSDGRLMRKYTYANVPTNTELVIVTSSNTEADGWAPLYTYNIYIYDGDPDYDPTTKVYTRMLQALSIDDFQSIPSVAIGRTIPPGNGAIGGEVHDCDNIRVQNAAVDISAKRAQLAYFNDDEETPLPDLSRSQLGFTGTTGLYSALNVPPGAARVAATGLVADGEQSRLVSLGYFDVRVYPDAVTSVTLRGLRPFQVP